MNFENTSDCSLNLVVVLGNTLTAARLREQIPRKEATTMVCAIHPQTGLPVCATSVTELQKMLIRESNKTAYNPDTRLN